MSSVNLSYATAEGRRLHFTKVAIAFGEERTMDEMRSGRMTLTHIPTRRKTRLCQRDGHPWQAVVTMSHIESIAEGPYFRVTRHACCRCGWHEEPTRSPLNLEPAATNIVTYHSPDAATRQEETP